MVTVKESIIIQNNSIHQENEGEMNSYNPAMDSESLNNNSKMNMTSKMNHGNESALNEKEMKEKIRINKNFEAKILEYMFKQWGIDWDFTPLCTKFIRDEIEPEVSYP